MPERNGLREGLRAAASANSKGKCRKTDAQEHEHGRFGHDERFRSG